MCNIFIYAYLSFLSVILRPSLVGLQFKACLLTLAPMSRASRSATMCHQAGGQGERQCTENGHHGRRRDGDSLTIVLSLREVSGWLGK